MNILKFHSDMSMCMHCKLYKTCENIWNRTLLCFVGKLCYSPLICIFLLLFNYIVIGKHHLSNMQRRAKIYLSFVNFIFLQKPSNAVLEISLQLIFSLYYVYIYYSFSNNTCFDNQGQLIQSHDFFSNSWF